MPRKAKAKQAAKSLTFTDEENRPTYKLKTGEVVPMSDKRIAAMKKSAWDKGESGNPEGRPPLPEVTKMKMYEFTEEAIEILKDIARNSPNEAAKLKAALSFVTPFVAPAASVQEVNHNVSGNLSVSKFLLSITEDFERDPSLLIDVTPEKTDISKEP
jgi:hypothetical protein